LERRVEFSIADGPSVVAAMSHELIGTLPT
jgi:hypothetical protein